MNNRVGNQSARWMRLGMGLAWMICAAGCGKAGMEKPHDGREEMAKTNSASSPPEVFRMETGGLHVGVENLGDGVFAIDVMPVKAGDAQSGETKSGAVTLDAESGRVVLRHDGRVIWDGRIEKVTAFGRAGVPGLAVSWRAREGEALYGLGERFDSLDVAGRRVEMWIADAPGQAGGTASYFTTPVLYSRAGYGLFAADNPEGVFDLNSAGDGWNRYERTGQELKLWVVAGQGLRELVKKRTEIIGGLRRVPDWVWGPWISRNSYENQGEAEAAIEAMAERDIPVGAIVQEAWKGPNETGEYNSFSRGGWPDPDRFLARCAELGIRNVLWQVPILHPSSPNFREAEARGYLVKAPDGSVRLRRHWLEGNGNIDFTNPDAVAFWQDLMRPLFRKQSISGFKADDGEDIEPEDVFADGRRGWQMHNEYSALYAQALTDLMDEEGVDGFLWSRSGSLGIEKVPGLWAGDQFASWEQMATLVPAGLSASLSGSPFWGHDIGGYIGDPGPELYVRWAQFGALSPLMQYHGIQPREPWHFGERVAAIYQKLARLRMNLRPLLIQLGQEAVETGQPIMRPLAMEFPDDKRFTREQTEYMLGPDILAAPVLAPGAGRRVIFPEGTWQHLLHPVSFRGGGEIDMPLAEESVPAFVRAGAVIPMELEEGVEPGEWRKGVPVREQRYGPDRALAELREAPFRADVVERKAEVVFAAKPGTASRLAVESRRGEFEAWRTHEKTDRGGGVVAVDLVLTEDRPRPGDGLEYRIVLRGEEVDRLVFPGKLVWESPVELKANLEGAGYVEAGRRLMPTKVRNISQRPLEVRVRIDMDEDVEVPIREQTVMLPPGGEQTLEWVLDFRPRAGTGDRRVSFAAECNGIWVAGDEVILARPWRWIVAGPFPMSPRTGHRTPLPPEWRIGPDWMFETREGPVRWWALDAGHPERNDGIDFTEAFGPREDAVAYALTKIRSDRDQEVELWLGSDDTLAVWVNGEKGHDAETYRGAAPGQDKVWARLKRGENLILAKVAQDKGGWKLHFRVTGPGGKPATGLEDGFDNIEVYDPHRPNGTRREPEMKPATWKVAGPFAPGTMEERLAEQGDRALAGMEWHRVQAPLPADEAIDLNKLLGSREDAEAVAITEVAVKRDTPVEIRCGSDDGLTLWLNGDERHDVEHPRGFTPGEDRIRVTLAPGLNRIVARIRQADGDWKFRIEVWDVSMFPPRPLLR